MSVTYSNPLPFSSNGGGIAVPLPIASGGTGNTTQNFVDLTTGQTVTGLKIWQTVHVDASAETLATWRLDEDTTSSLSIANGTATNASFAPLLSGVNSGANFGLSIRAAGTTDTGTVPILVIDSRLPSAAALVRPLVDFRNFATSMVQLIPSNSGAGVIQLFTPASNIGAPTFTSRSIGTRTVFQPVIDGTHVDNAIGVQTSGLWFSLPIASGAQQFTWFAGITPVASLSGVGLLTLTGACQLKSYTVATLPATPAAGLIAYASDAAVAPCVAFGNGTNWKRCDNAATTVV